jgi:RNA polymerase sigma-54 factor
MALSPRLEIRQSQSLVMTPQLMQAIKLLQLSNLDLAAYVDAELESNPLLERAALTEDGASPENPHASADRGDIHGPGGPESQVDSAPDVVTPAAGGIEEKIDIDLASVFPDDHEKPADEIRPSLEAETWTGLASRQPISGDAYNLEAFVAKQKSLAEHLSEQFNLAVADPALRLIGHALINEIDETGYLRSDLAPLAELLGASRADVEAALDVIHSLDPPGVGARDLAECLSLQLRERNRLDPAMGKFIENLDLVARRDLARLQALCGVDREDLVDMLAEVRLLDPRPGHAFSAGFVQIVVPDVLVRPAPDGSWLIELNQDALPKVLIDQAYYTTVTAGLQSKTDRNYLSDCLQSASWLVKSLDQRAKTILKVASEIVRQQDAFLVHGVQHLRPLNLKTVAEAIGMHESTVSRVTSNKYMATNRGIFELKYFFTAAIPSSGDAEAHSAEAVRHRIRKLIAGERAGSVLSDDAIVALLADSGIDIARRTVAKYRENLRIPSSVQRRRELKSAF